jgi:hypothetical protein
MIKGSESIILTIEEIEMLLSVFGWTRGIKESNIKFYDKAVRSGVGILVDKLTELVREQYRIDEE